MFKTIRIFLLSILLALVWSLNAHGQAPQQQIIVTPDQNGVSHNQLTDFNVGTEGLIINNSASGGTTNNFGSPVVVNPNANLATSGSANLIINEVTGSNSSNLLGAIEVFGGKADLIIANQNGITCNGCGFINVHRSTLTTGRIEYDANANQLNLLIERGQVTVGSLGVDITGADYFDIISRTIQISGNIQNNNSANDKEVRLYAGLNTFDYQVGATEGSITSSEDGDGTVEDAVLIDSSLLGGAYVNRIKIVSTERGAGVRSTGAELQALRGGIHLSANGKLTLGKVTSRDKTLIEAKRYSGTSSSAVNRDIDLQDDISAGEIEIAAVSGNINNSGILSSNTTIAISTSTSGDLTNTGTISGQTTTNLNIAGTLDNQSGGQITSGGALTAQVGSVNNAGTISSSDTDITSTGGVTNSGSITGTSNLRIAGSNIVNSNELRSGSGSVNLSTTSGDLTNTGTISGQTTTNLNIAGTLDNQSGGQITSGGALTAQVGSVNNAGTISSSDTDITSTGGVTNSGSITGTSNLRIAGSNIVNSNELRSGSGSVNLSTTSGDLTNTGTISGQTTTNLNIAGTLDNQSGGQITSGGNLVIFAGSLDNQGTIQSTLGGIDITVLNDLTNSGLISSNSDTRFEVAGVLTNRTGAEIVSGGSLTIENTGDVINEIGAKINTVGKLTVSANSFNNDGRVDESVVDGEITADDIEINVSEFRNAGLIQSSKEVNITALRNVLNVLGVIQANGKVNIQASEKFENLFGTISGQNGTNVDAATIFDVTFLRREDFLVLENLFARLGGRLLPGYVSEEDMIRALYSNAQELEEELKLTPGVALNQKQIDGLKKNILWMVEVKVKGKVVLAPRLYLSNGFVKKYRFENATLYGEKLSLQQ